MFYDSRILQDPDARLHTRSQGIKDFKEAKKIASELLSVVKVVSRFWKLWLGFAAPQIGYNKRIIVLRDGIKKYKVMVNPEILEARWPFFYLGRCYSLQGRYILKGHLWTKLKYQDLEGSSRTQTIFGPSALEHEIDHLNGVLAYERGKRIL
jgi:peptide deformylase